MRPLTELNKLGHHPLAQVIEQKGRLAVERPAADGMHQTTDQAGGKRRFKQHRKLTGFNLAPTEAGNGALGGDPADKAGIVEEAGVAAGGVPVVALHGVLFAGNDRAGNVVT